jgi:hypothetical protein
MYAQFISGKKKWSEAGIAPANGIVNGRAMNLP